MNDTFKFAPCLICESIDQAQCGCMFGETIIEQPDDLPDTEQELSEFDVWGPL